MKPSRILIAFLILLFPVLARTVWFYRGIFTPPENLTTPDYAGIRLPENLQSTLIPPKPAVLEIEKSRACVLIDANHGNLFTVTELQPLFDRITETGGTIQITDANQLLDEALKKSDSYVVIAPASAFLPGELSSIRQFVNRGGKLLVISDPTRDLSNYGYYFGDTAGQLQSVSITNALLQPYGITFIEDYLYDQQNNEGNFRNIFLDEIASKSALTQNINKLVFYGAHSINAAGGGLILTGNTTFSSRTDAGGNFIVAAVASQGNVLALGDFTFLTHPYYTSVDNQQLVRNIAAFLAEKRRVRTISDLPYYFERQTDFLVAMDAAISREKLGMFSLFQSALEYSNISLALVEKPRIGHDLIIAGKFNQYEELEEYLKPFNLQFENIEAEEEPATDKSPVKRTSQTPTSTKEATLPSPGDSITATPETTGSLDMNDLFSFLENPGTKNADEGTVNIPGLGKFSTDGIGLILLNPRQERNTLILLTENHTGMTDLVDYFVTGDLSRCAHYHNMAICAVTKESHLE